MDNFKRSDIGRKNTASVLSKKSESSDSDSISLSKDLPQEHSNMLNNSEEKRIEILNKTKNCSQLLLSFSRDPVNFNNEHLKTALISILTNLQSYKQKLEDENFGFSFIEQTHYLYKLDKIKDLPKPLKTKLKKAKSDSIDPEINNFDIYETFNKLLSLLSRLMVKMGIFDIHNYSYRFKGRSLTILFFDMAEINKECLSMDIIWMSFAVNHMPFKKTVGKLLLNYSKIFQHCLTKIFNFLMEISENLTELQTASFEIVPFYMRIFKKKTPETVRSLYNQLTDLEKSYRCFERALLEESLKMV